MEIQENDSLQTQQPKKIKKGWFIALLILFAVVLVFVFFRFQDFGSVFSKIANVLEPVFYGIALAYLLNPIMVVFEKLYAFAATRIFKAKTDKYKKLGTTVSIVFTILVLFVLVYILFSSILPQLYQTIMSLIGFIPDGLDKVSEWYDDLRISDAQWIKTLGLDFDDLLNRVEVWFTENLAGMANQVLGYITTGVKSAVSFIANVVIGLCVAVYLLKEKNVLFAHLRKATYAIFKKPRAENIVRMGVQAKDIFNGYIYGNVVGCLIVFAATLIFMKITGMPYAILISTIVAITNFIPFFGPFIGAVPSILILLIYDPMMAITFTIFTLVLQQVEGHFLTPLIISDQTGVSPFWVTVALLVGAGFFGIMGLILAVPIFSVIYYILKEAFEKKLSEKRLPVATDEYVIDNDFEIGNVFSKLKERRNRGRKAKRNKH